MQRVELANQTPWFQGFRVANAGVTSVLISGVEHGEDVWHDSALMKLLWVPHGSYVHHLDQELIGKRHRPAAGKEYNKSYPLFYLPIPFALLFCVTFCPTSTPPKPCSVRLSTPSGLPPHAVSHPLSGRLPAARPRAPSRPPSATRPEAVVSNQKPCPPTQQADETSKELYPVTQPPHWPSEASRNNATGTDADALDRFKIREICEGWGCYRDAAEWENYRSMVSVRPQVSGLPCGQNQLLT